MHGLQRLSGFQRTPPGREWWLWKRLPALLAVGMALPLPLLLALRWAAPDAPSPAQEREVLLTHYRVIGVVLLHWTLVVTVAIGRVVVMVMKGPAYVADGYPPPGRDLPG